MVQPSARNLARLLLGAKRISQLQIEKPATLRKRQQTSQNPSFVRCRRGSFLETRPSLRSLGGRKHDRQRVSHRRRSGVLRHVHDERFLGRGRDNEGVRAHHGSRCGQSVRCRRWARRNAFSSSRRPLCSRRRRPAESTASTSARRAMCSRANSSISLSAI